MIGTKSSNFILYMKTILCPTDFSDNSVDAYNFASQVAIILKANLILYHASTSPVGEIDSVKIEGSKLLSDIESKNKALLRTWQKLKNSESEEGKNAHFDFVVEQGFPLSSIIRAIQKYKADLVIMHTKGDQREKHEGIYIGSVGAQVVDETSANVMLVPPGISHEKVKQIVYAINLNEYDSKSVATVLMYAQQLNAHLNFLYVATNDSEGEVENFKNKFLNEPNSDLATIHFRKGNGLLNIINEFLVEINSDMLVMERRKKNILEKFFTKSLVKEMTHHTRIPLLIMHVKE